MQMELKCSGRYSVTFVMSPVEFNQLTKITIKRAAKCYLSARKIWARATVAWHSEKSFLHPCPAHVGCWLIQHHFREPFIDE